MPPIHDERIVIICRNCGRSVGPIFLPEPSPPDTAEGPPVITRGGFPESVACPVCGHVYGYRTDDFQIRLLGTPALQGVHPDKVSVLATRICGVKSCESLVEIHTAAAFGVTTEELSRIASRWVFHVQCPRGHDVAAAPPSEYQFEIQKGGWSPSGGDLN